MSRCEEATFFLVGPDFQVHTCSWLTRVLLQATATYSWVNLFLEKKKVKGYSEATRLILAMVKPLI